MTDLIDRADSDMPDAPGERTTNLAAYILRQGEVYSRHRLAAADTMIVRTDLTADPQQVADAKLRIGEPFIGVPYAGRDAWIFDIDGELQEPPSGNPPKLPPTPPKPTKAERPADFRPAHRRRLDRLVKGILIGAGAVTAALLGVDLAAALVMGWLW